MQTATHACPWPNEYAPGEDWPISHAMCCEKAVRVNFGCVCAFVTCCPDHGHWHFGSHE